MTTDEMQLLLDYHFWAAGRVLDAAGRCTPEQLVAAASVPHGTLLSTLLHILASDVTWLTRIRDGRTPADFPRLERISTVEELRRAWEEHEGELRAYVDGLPEGQLAGRIRYIVSRAAWRDEALWHTLIYMVLHGVQHRSEAATLLTEYGQSPGNLDFMAYIWGRGAMVYEPR